MVQHSTLRLHTDQAAFFDGHASTHSCIHTHTHKHTHTHTHTRNRIMHNQVDGLNNPLVQAVHLADCPIQQAAWATSGSQVGLGAVGWWCGEDEGLVCACVYLCEGCGYLNVCIESV